MADQRIASPGVSRRTLGRASLLALAPPAVAAPAGDTQVYASGDGLPVTPEEYGRLLTKLAANDGIGVDDYSRGGVVAKLETRVASMLGKESAIWMPTGTLANQMAVRQLAGLKRRVLVQAESHLYRDCGDCCQTLSGLNLVALAPGKATFTLADVERAAYDAAGGRVETHIGAIQIETPVRRSDGEQFDFAEMKRISEWARSHGVGMHLDGARLFLESAYTQRPLREYAALFDTVYVSMYKYFNASSGAMLAGPKRLIDGLYHTRRMFGGSLAHAWPLAAIALHFLDGFEQRYAKAVRTSETVLTALAKDPAFEITRVPRGTNIFHLRTQDANGPVYQNRLHNAGITAAAPTGQRLTLRVNETWARASAEEILSRFRKGLA